MDLGQYFVKDYTGPKFELFSPSHLATLLIIVLFIFWLMRFKGSSEAVRSKVRWTMAITLWSVEAIWHIWNISVGMWTIQTMLPLHMCSVLVWLTGFMLIYKKYSIYEFVYFLGIGGALQAVLTPDVGIYSFPHFRYIQTFFSHGLLISAGIYMTVVEGFRPTWKSILRVFAFANLYMLVIFFVNSAIGSDYLFINSKPPMATVLDMLPAWPFYIPWLEVIALFTCLILYTPFFIKDLRANSRLRSNTNQDAPDM
jgi:hypothetical integral membrane protein (TIGR02206 family)